MAGSGDIFLISDMMFIKAFAVNIGIQFAFMITKIMDVIIAIEKAAEENWTLLWLEIPATLGYLTFLGKAMLARTSLHLSVLKI